VPEPTIHDTIPPEREILKTYLWQKIDLTRSVIEKHRFEIETQFQATIEELQRVSANLIARLQEENSRLRKELLSDYKKENTAIILAQAEATRLLQQKVVENEARIEAKFKLLSESTESMAERVASDIFADVVHEVNAMRKEITAIRADFHKALTEHQMEVRSKVSGIDGKLGRIVSALRQFMKIL